MIIKHSQGKIDSVYTEGEWKKTKKLKKDAEKKDKVEKKEPKEK